MSSLYFRQGAIECLKPITEDYGGVFKCIIPTAYNSPFTLDMLKESTETLRIKELIDTRMFHGEYDFFIQNPDLNLIHCQTINPEKSVIDIRKVTAVEYMALDCYIVEFSVMGFLPKDSILNIQNLSIYDPKLSMYTLRPRVIVQKDSTKDKINRIILVTFDIYSKYYLLENLIHNDREKLQEYAMWEV